VPEFDIMLKNRGISRQVKRHIGRSIYIALFVLYIVSEIWTLNEKMKRKPNALEIDYLHRSERMSDRRELEMMWLGREPVHNK
jgi:hypothetical protein